MATNTGGTASQLVDRLLNDAAFRESLDAAPTLHAKAELVRAAGYGEVSLEAIQEAAKKQLAALGVGVQVDPVRVKRVEELFIKAAADKELQQALQAAATPEAKREVLAQAGYGDITLDDLKAAAADLAQREELSDDELEAVSGGADAGAVIGGTMAGAALTGAGMGAVAGGPAGAAVGAVLGAAAWGTVLGIQYLQEAPPPSDW